MQLCEYTRAAVTGRLLFLYVYNVLCLWLCVCWGGGQELWYLVWSCRTEYQIAWCFHLQNLILVFVMPAQEERSRRVLVELECILSSHHAKSFAFSSNTSERMQTSMVNFYFFKLPGIWWDHGSSAGLHICRRVQTWHPSRRGMQALSIHQAAWAFHSKLSPQELPTPWLIDDRAIWEWDLFYDLFRNIPSIIWLVLEDC